MKERTVLQEPRGAPNLVQAAKAELFLEPARLFSPQPQRAPHSARHGTYFTTILTAEHAARGLGSFF